MGIMMVAEGNLERIGRGIYVLPDALEDEMYIMQRKYPNLVYSHETALFFHGISDRTPFEYTATVPSGYKVVDKVSERFKIFYIKKDLHSMGITELETTVGNTIKIYNLDYILLLDYARKLKVENLLNTYMEILL